MTTGTCESCGMTMATASDHGAGNEQNPYCTYCTTETGELQSFESRFENFTGWTMRQDNVDLATAQEKTREYMRSMPAWKDNPALTKS